MRLRSLATQMSYRLDEGNGLCTYQVGVEDNGCHSLLDYESVAESARILECIARSLNAVVISRTMIQNEVTVEEEISSGSSTITTGEHGSMKIVKTPKSHMIIGKEDPVFVKQTESGEEENDEAKEEKSDIDEAMRSTTTRLSKKKGAFTRCELVMQRVETHLIDSTPIPLVELASGNQAVLSTAEDSKTAKDNFTSQNGGEDTGEESKIPTSNESNMDNNNGNNTKIGAMKVNPKSASVSETLSSRNIRVAVVGNVDAGKSTLIGTLTTSSLDDGRGRSRTSIMKHRHEIETGRTSTASTHLMGFKHTGEPISGKDSVRANKRKTEDEIARESFRIVSLMDLAGHEKYLKTTIHGVSSGMADYSLILVNSRHPPTHMTQHHLNLCCSFGIPTIIVFTKIDGCPEHALKNSKQELNKLLRSPDVARKPFAIRKEEDIITCMGKLHTLAPIIETSCVTGEGLDLIRKLLFSLPKRRRHENKVNRPFEFLVEDLFLNVPGVGAVVSGFVNAGELTVGPNTHVYVGPTDDGTFIRTVAKSAHISRISTSHVTAGQSACLAFAVKKEDKAKLRRGMVVVKEQPSSTREFDAEICVLKGEGTTIRRSYQAYVHILNVRQSAFAKNIEIVNTNALGLPPSHSAHNDDEDGIVLRPGSRAKVRFEFAQRPEYVRPGMRMLFRDGRVRGVGLITGVPEIQA
mmetsp:Transcript_17913/g.25265  ORF Transcript_17913/g.25265 Transcript_17913/m.25265 type:complete len:693 (-) Transcript_17913:1582-3660(-)